jgi:hypothetical protein
MHAIQVRKPLVPGRTRWPEVGELNLYDNGLELHLFFRNPTKAEIRGVKQGNCACALVVLGDVLFFLYRFAGVPWSDAPYSWHRVPADRRVLPALQDTGQMRGLLQIILTDADTGIVQAQRAVSLSVDFTRALLSAIRMQASTPWCGQAEYDRQLAAVYERFPSGGIRRLPRVLSPRRG